MMPSTNVHARLQSILNEMQHELSCRDWNGCVERCNNALAMRRRLQDAIDDYRDTWRLEMPLLTAFRRREQ